MNLKLTVRTVGYLITLAMVLSLFPLAVFAANNPEEIPETDYTEFTIVGWENDGPDGAIKSVAINGEDLPEKGGTMKVAPSAILHVEIVFNKGYMIGEWLDCVILRFGGIQSGATNIKNSSSASYIPAPPIEWLTGVYGEDSMDHEIYLIIPTTEDESIPKYTLSFETNGGSDIASVTTFEDSVISLSDYTTTKSDYTFDGWYTDEALTQKVTSVTLDKNMTVYAKWTETAIGSGSTDSGSSSDVSTPITTPSSDNTLPPQTGDSNNTPVWIVLAGISLLGIIIILVGSKFFHGRKK